MKAHLPRLLGLWPGWPRPEPQPCPRCGRGWLWPLSESLWFCGHCHWLWPEEEPKPTVGIQLALSLNGHGGRVFVPGPRRYADRFGNEVLRR
jgi:hypothetical protein